jgi:hypothetical protein
LKNADTQTFHQCYEKSEPDVPAAGAALGATMGASHWRKPVPTTRGITGAPGDAALTIGVSWNGQPAREVKCAAHSSLDDVLDAAITQLVGIEDVQCRRMYSLEIAGREPKTYLRAITVTKASDSIDTPWSLVVADGKKPSVHSEAKDSHTFVPESVAV